MKTIQLTTKTDENGMLNLKLPLETPLREMDVIVVFQPVPKPTTPETTSRGWPPGFFRETAGAFADDPIERPDQGGYEFSRVQGLDIVDWQNPRAS